MFDFRYHALSLVAVLLALMIGLLLGVAIGDRGLVSGAERNLRTSLRGDVRAARAHAADLQRQLNEQKRLQADIYPLLVQGRLQGRRVGLFALGSLPDEMIRSVRGALEGTGATLSAVAVIREPVSADVVPPPPGKAPAATGPATSDYRRFGAQVGGALLNGGRTLNSIRRSVLSSSSGQLGGLDAVVLVRQPPELSPDAAPGTEAFEVGLVEGMAAANVQMAGVEQTTTTPSQVPWFQERRLPSVDDVDAFAGRAALVFVLAGANGSFGVKETAEALVPNTAGRTRATATQGASP